MKKTFAVIGLGIFGRRICEILTQKGGDVIAIDNNPSQINRVKDFVTQAILLDSADEDSLAEAPFEQVDAAIVAIGDNIEASILTTALLKQLGVSYIISRAVNRTHYQVLKQIGADEIINIEEDEGTMVAINLISPSHMEKVKLSKDIVLSEMIVPIKYINYTVENLELEKKFNSKLVAVRRSKTSLDADGVVLKNEELLFLGDNDKLIESDVLILVGKEIKLEEFQKSGELEK